MSESELATEDIVAIAVTGALLSFGGSLLIWSLRNKYGPDPLLLGGVGAVYSGFSTAVVWSVRNLVVKK